MNTIIHEIMEKITVDIENNLEDLILNSKDISKFIVNTSKSLDEIGVRIVKGALELLDEIVRNSKDRKKEYHIQRRDDEKTLITKFGIHEGRKLKSKGRYELINKRYFTGSLKNNEDLWLEVANYLDEAYDLDGVDKIYISGDGARWIKEGLHWIKGPH